MQIFDTVTPHKIINRPRYHTTFFYCSNCGTNVLDQDIGIDLCPFCKAKLVRQPGFFYSDRDLDRVDQKTVTKKFSELRSLRASASIKKTIKALKKQMYESNIVEENTVLESSLDVVNKINEDRHLLLTYIKHLIELETSYYAVEKELTSLLTTQFGCSEYILFIQKHAIIEAQKKHEKLIRGKKKIEKEIQDFNIEDKWKKEAPVAPNAPSEPELLKANVFNKKKIQAENEALMSAYEAKHKIYLEELDQYNSSLIAYNEEKNQYEAKARNDLDQKLIQINREIEAASAEIEVLVDHSEEYFASNPEVIKKEFVADEVKTATDLLISINEGLNKLYSYNIIYPKYRNLVAISSFFEYLESGRCTSLEGANGAYNLYEAEIRSNQVIAQLNEVIKSLEQIKENQYLIYSKLCSIDNQLSSLNVKMNAALKSLDSIQTSSKITAQNMEKVAENSEIIAYNTEKTAFYTQKNAELTNAIGFMIALK